MRILVIEDEVNLNDIIVKKLKLERYGVDSCLDGKEALDYIFSTEYDVILMDIQMPNMNGYQAAEAIRALPGKRGEIPIVAMTANAFEEDRRKALESGMNAHIAKPVDVSVLLETLSRFS